MDGSGGPKVLQPQNKNSTYAHICMLSRVGDVFFRAGRSQFPVQLCEPSKILKPDAHPLCKTMTFIGWNLRETKIEKISWTSLSAWKRLAVALAVQILVLLFSLGPARLPWSCHLQQSQVLGVPCCPSFSISQKKMHRAEKRVRIQNNGIPIPLTLSGGPIWITRERIPAAHSRLASTLTGKEKKHPYAWL